MSRGITLHTDFTSFNSRLLRYRLIVGAIICLSLTVLTINNVSANNPFEAHSSSMDYTIYEMASEQNDAASQYLLGKKYLYGKTVNKNVQEAVKWFELSAQQNHSKAQFILGKLYLDGKRIPQDYTDAKIYLTLAAGNHHVEAQYELGNYYLQGPAEDKQPNMALKWYKLAAEQRHGGALFAAGKMLYEGTEVKIDKSKGKHLLKLSVETGYTPAIKYYADLSKESAPAEKSKRKSKNDLIKVKDASSQFNLGLAYLYGDGREKNIQLALDWLYKAAKNESVEAQYLLGVMYKDGISVKKDEALAVDWLKQATQSGSKDAKVELDNSLYNNLYRQALEYTGNKNTATANAKYAMALLYLDGKFVTKDSSMAYKWALGAAELNQVDAQKILSQMYRDGIGVEKNTIEANNWEKIANDGLASKSKATTPLSFKIASPQNEATQKSKIGKEIEKIGHNEARPKAKIVKIKQVNKVAITKNTEDKKHSLPQKVKLDVSQNSEVKSLLLNAKKGDTDAMYGLGIVYLNDQQEEEKAIAEGIKWLERAAMGNHITAQRWLGEMYLQGHFVDINYDKASKWYSLAASEGDANSQYHLAELYQKGLGVEKNNATAIKWFREAAVQGHKKARNKLGGCRIC